MTPADWSPFMWFPMFPIFFMLLGLAIFLFVMVPMIGRHGPWHHWSDAPPFSNRRALDILNERYASGEIDKAEYDEKRRTLLQGG